MTIHGRDEKGATSYLGVAVPDFPNWLMISGELASFAWPWIFTDWSRRF